MNQLFKQRIEEHTAVLSKLSEVSIESAESISQAIAKCFLNGGRLYICGGGTSHVIAKYIESLFMGGCRMARPPLPAVTLLPDYYLSIDNPAEIFEKQLAALLTSADMILAISAAPAPEALVKALRYAGHMDVPAMGLAGRDQGTLHGLCDSLITVENNDPLIVTELHMVLAHIICHRVDEIIFTGA